MKEDTMNGTTNSNDVRPADHAAAQKKNKHGADLLLVVAGGKHTAATMPAGIDKSAMIAAAAKAAGWNKS
jgi:hypothetical protein